MTQTESKGPPGSDGLTGLTVHHHTTIFIISHPTQQNRPQPDNAYFDTHDLHMHVPEGAIPKVRTCMHACIGDRLIGWLID